VTKVRIVAVGRARGPIAEAIDDYETRIRHYFAFTVMEVREETCRGPADVPRVKNQEGERLLARASGAVQLVALYRGGKMWSSGHFARYLDDPILQVRGGVVFLIGGAFGLAESVVERATHRVSLSACTLPHELARLVLTEQLYRAGTIARGEPYHKGLVE
jgi:23S rRNA (pseudouridine1915-N3)-methyltransferase